MSSAPRDTTTAEVRYRAVVEVVRYMRANLLAWNADLSLAALARKGGYSKPHLIQIFEEVTGTTPHHFYSSLRMQKAKELLVFTSASVTQIALDIGYESFSTFSRTFLRYVGMPPQRFREETTAATPMKFPLELLARSSRAAETDSIAGAVTAPDTPSGVIFIGAFTKGVPQGRPFAGTVLMAPGPFRLVRPAVPRFHLLAAHFSRLPQQLLSSQTLVPDLVAGLRINESSPREPQLALRPLREVDPPLVMAPLALLA